MNKNKTKLINIKMMNGDIFPIEITQSDYDEDKIINKICSYNHEYRLRKHRIKILNEEYEEYQEYQEYDHKSFKEIIYDLNDKETLSIFSDSPYNVKKYCLKNSLLEFNYFYLKYIEDYYDVLDRLFLGIYDNELPSLFVIDNNFFDINYSEMYIDILIKTIFEKEDIKRIFFDFYCISDISYVIKCIKCINKYYNKKLDKFGLDIDFDKNKNINKKILSIDKGIIKELFGKISDSYLYISGFFFSYF